ncbi:hypothetical protein MD484_g1333, partial [Candolleomyces efflorescens]
MKGLDAYGGDESDGGGSSSPQGKKNDDGPTKKLSTNSARGGGSEVNSRNRITPPTLTNLNLSSTNNNTPGIPGIVIRKPPASHRHRSHHPNPNSTTTTASSSSSQNGRNATTFVASAGDTGAADSEMEISGDENENEDDELVQIRKLLRPPPIPGVENWGIPPEPSEGAVDLDPEVLTKLSTFLHLKHNPTTPKHFNDSLMSNRSFRNPHLYATLVDWAGVKNEKVSNFPTDIWDAEGLHLEEGWFVEGLTEAQKRRADKIQREQEQSKALGGGMGKRKIEFASAAAAAGGGVNKGNNFYSHSNTSSGSVAAPARFQPYGSSGSREYSRGSHGASGKPTRWG